MQIVERAAGVWQHLVGKVEAADLNRIEENTRRAAAEVPAVFDSTAGKVNGPLAGQQTASGHTWIGTGSVAPQYRDGVIGYPAGATSGSYYCMIETASRCIRVRDRFRFTSSDQVGSSVCIGIFDSANPAAGGSSPAHCSITPTFLRFSTFSAGLSNEIVHAPVGTVRTEPRWPRPIPCDGTWIDVEILVDPARNTAVVIIDLPDGPMAMTFTHDRIGAIAARFPFVQGYGVAGQGNLGEWDAAAFAADVAPSAARGRSPHAELLTVGKLAAARPASGVGPIGARPPSALRGGAAWTIPDQTLAITAATAAGATTFTCAQPIRVGTRVQVDAGTNREFRTVTALAGSAAAWTVTVDAAFAVAHAAGAAVAVPARTAHSDGARWLEQGVVVGNRIDPATALAAEEVAGFGQSGLTAAPARVARPLSGFRTPRVHRVAAAGTAAAVTFLNAGVPAEAGEPIASFTGQVAGSVARSAYTGLRFLDGAGTLIGADFYGAAQPVATSGAPTELAPVRAVAPAGTASAQWLLWFGAGAAGDVMWFTEIGIGLAHGATPTALHS